MQRVALVTGGNRGLGFETCRQLGRLGCRIILTSRSLEQGQVVCHTLRKEGVSVRLEVLDVTDWGGVAQLERSLRENLDSVDILVNNAGVLLDRGHPVVDENLPQASVFNVNLETLSRTMEVNAFGALRLCQVFTPWMRERNYGRVVNVSSNMGQMSMMGGGWAAYRLSKVALNAVTCIFSAELHGENVLVNSVSPGWVRTTMGGADAPLSVEDAVDTIVWLATLPDGGPSGKFFRSRTQIDW